jgi:predicted ATPase
MLTRLKLNGFKNLRDIDLQFGPFTCIAGPNGVGKSNVFDAIGFLSNLSNKSLIESALSVRDEDGRSRDIRGLFFKIGDSFADEMTLEAEMIIPEQGVDDLGQEAKASATFVRYRLRLGYRNTNGDRTAGPIELREEQLSHITLQNATESLAFPHSTSWRRSVVKNRRRTAHYISTNSGNVQVHQDSGGHGRPRRYLASSLPRTALSAADAAESPTATLVKREMESWKLLHLEPSALRSPDDLTATPRIGSDGSHLPATLYHLAHHETSNDDRASSPIYTDVANVLSDLLDDVRSVHVDRDEKRELLTMFVTGRDGTPHPARALSDGTLRFLALAVMTMDAKPPGLICLEEPENGIHPDRLSAMVELLQRLAFDANEPINEGNPLSQVIVNTHSPSVVALVPEDSVLFAEPFSRFDDGVETKLVKFACLDRTWRSELPQSRSFPIGKLLSYLYPAVRRSLEHQAITRVIDRPDAQLELFDK